MSGLLASAAHRPAAPATVGQAIARHDRYSREDIEAFATACRDGNPLHSDDARAQRSRFGEVIASAQHTSAMLLGLATSHFSSRGSEVLVMHVNFAFRSPVFANEEVQLRWKVGEVAWNERLQGHVLLLNGEAGTTLARHALVARATLLVKALG